MSVLDIAATEVVTADRNDTVSEVARTMADEGVGSVVIEEELDEAEDVIEMQSPRMD